MPNETNDTSFAGFFDGPRVPSLISYCASAGCGTGWPCNACRIEDGLLCGVCQDATAVLIEDDDSRGGLPLCAACKAEGDAEDAAANPTAVLWCCATCECRHERGKGECSEDAAGKGGV